MSPDIADRIFATVSGARYVASYLDGKLATVSKVGLSNASGDESDRYEELLVNPTLLTLATQRGNIDCGGLHYLVVRYGHFYQFIHPVPGGHISVALEPEVSLDSSLAALLAVMRDVSMRD
jgi:hypothetical protein